MKTEFDNVDNEELNKSDVSGSSVTDIVYGVSIFIMLIIMVFGAVVWALNNH